MNRTDKKVYNSLRDLKWLAAEAEDRQRYADAETLERAHDELRRARFHERENCYRWQQAAKDLDDLRALLREHRGSKSRAKRRLIAKIDALLTDAPNPLTPEASAGVGEGVR